MTREEYIEEIRGGRPAVVSMLEALCQAEEIGWETARTKLLTLSRELGFMPTASEMRDKLLREFGYIRLTGVGRRQMSSDVRRWMDENFQRPGVRAIVRVYHGEGFMLPLLPFPDPEKGPTAIRYEYWGDLPFDKMSLVLTDIYIYIRTDDGCVPAGRQSGRRKRAVLPPAETKWFHYENVNPVRVTGDCVVRAIAAAAGLSWREVFDGLAECAGPDGLVLNTYDVYAPYLRRLGFVQHDELREGNKPLTGDQFCRAMGELFHNGERVVTCLGRSHIAAVLPFRTSYRIVDTWNSSGKTARDSFWVLDPSAAGGQRPENK